jgi:hypothetical protein
MTIKKVTKEDKMPRHCRQCKAETTYPSDGWADVCAIPHDISKSAEQMKVYPWFSICPKCIAKHCPDIPMNIKRYDYPEEVH